MDTRPVAFALVDVSGSTPADALVKITEILREFSERYRVMVIEFTIGPDKMYPFEGKRFEFSVVGGGTGNLAQVFAQALTYQPDLLLVFTDGYFSLGELPPEPDVPVFWMMTIDEDGPEWGTTLKFEDWNDCTSSN